MYRKLPLILLFLIFLFPLHASGSMEKKNNEEVSIVSLAPNVTEILFELDLGKNIVGRTDYCNYPKEALNIPSIGSLTSPDLERIISLKPDIVIASSIVPENLTDKLKNAGIKTYRFMEEYNGIDGVFELIKQVGEVTGKSEKANEILEAQKAELASIQSKVSLVKDRKKCAFIVSWGNNGDFAATGDTFIGKMIEYAGGINAANDASAWAWSKEGLLQSNPEVVLITETSNPTAKDPVKAFKQTEPYSLTAASRNNNVYLVDADSFERQGIRTVQSIKEIAKLLYPELFK